MTVVLVAAAAVAVGATRTTPVPAIAQPATVVPLSRTSLACPAVGDTGRPGSDTSYGVLPLRSASGGGARGRITTRVAPAKVLGKGAATTHATPPFDLGGTRRGTWSTRTVKGIKTATLLFGTHGALAPGLGAFDATTAKSQAGGGLAVAACTPPARSWTFVGAGSTVDHGGVVVLVNPDPTQAVATVTLSDRNGPVETVGGNGLVVPPSGSVVVPLAKIAAGVDDLAVSVQLSSGRVSAALLDTWVTGVQPQGTEWMPGAATPSTTTMIGSVPVGAARTLLVANPGDRTADVHVDVVAADGTFPATGLTQLEVGPGSVATAKLPASFGSKPVALRLRSSYPVTASVRVVTKGANPDIAYAPASVPLSGAAAVPAALAPAGSPTQIVLTAVNPDTATTARVTAFDAGGNQVGSMPVSVPAGQTVAVAPRSKLAKSVSVPWRKVSYLVVDPAAPVVASAVYRSGSTGVSILPLTVAPTQVLAPGVRPAR
ncbi:MAG: DUF5719 family protein [Nocardioidaceae bacterium]